MAWIYNGALIAPGTGMDSFNLMRAFRRIVERGGLARAAEDLGMSPAGLSKQRAPWKRTWAWCCCSGPRGA